jgi:hypothetical protein
MATVPDGTQGNGLCRLFIRFKKYASRRAKQQLVEEAQVTALSWTPDQGALLIRISQDRADEVTGFFKNAQAVESISLA